MNPLQSLPKRLGKLLLVLGGCALATRTDADALVVTKAMQATTIAEIYITKSEVRIELEVGAADLAAFAELLPEGIYATLSAPDVPYEQRVEYFFRTRLTIQDESAQLLQGHIDSLTARRRIARDAITGDPLPEQPTDAELVVFAVLVYQLENLPKRLTIRSFPNASSVANIGFVCYHNDLPINDFRYLAEEVNLNLDWRDPWYSHFSHSNLRRQFRCAVGGVSVRRTV